MIRLVMGFLSLVLALQLNTTIRAAEPDAVVNIGSLNVRAAPSASAKVIDQLPKNTTIQLDGRSADGAWLHGTADNGTIGWFSFQYVTIRATLNPTSLPTLGDSAPVKGPNPGPPSPSAVGNPAPLVTGSVRGGFEVGGQIQGFDPNTMADMHHAGMKWIKIQGHVGDGGVAGAIGVAHSNGFKILISVVGDKDSYPDSGYQQTFASYVASLASAGADALEICNEMNIDREWKHGAINPATYVSLLAKSYNAIKAVSPNTIVISGALAPTGAESAFGLASVWNDDHYYAGMAAAGAGKYADCIGVHYNEGIVGPTQVSGDPRGNYPTRYFSTMLRRAIGPFGGKKACFTELGYLTPEGYSGLPGGFAWAANTTVAEQAAWLAQAAVRASASGQVRLMIVFNVDFTYYGDDPQAGYAMIRKGGACPACDALARVIH